MWKELIRLLSVEGQLKKTVLAEICMVYFSLVQCLIQFLQFFPFETAADHTLRNTVLLQPIKVTAVNRGTN
jgi:heme/copper-type cytochrome/quinol oxidase subunit 4